MLCFNLLIIKNINTRDHEYFARFSSDFMPTSMSFALAVIYVEFQIKMVRIVVSRFTKSFFHFFSGVGMDIAFGLRT